MSYNILSSDFSNLALFTGGIRTQSMWSLDMTLGGPDAIIDPTDPTTYRWAVRMPSIGLLRAIKVFFKSQSSGDPANFVDFSLSDTSFDHPDHDPLWDIFFEQKNITIGTVYDSSFYDNPIIFSNKQAYVGSVSPNGLDVTRPRNFIWMEVKPDDATGTAPLIKVNLKFDI